MSQHSIASILIEFSSANKTDKISPSWESLTKKKKMYAKKLNLKQKKKKFGK